jgi:hypothetical protein
MSDPRSEARGHSVHESVEKALELWVSRHPAPDVPALSIAQSGQFTPRQLLREVRERSDVGLLLEEMLESAVATGPASLDEILNLFRGSESERETPEKLGHKYF